MDHGTVAQGETTKRLLACLVNEDLVHVSRTLKIDSPGFDLSLGGPRGQDLTTMSVRVLCSVRDARQQLWLGDIDLPADIGAR